MTNQTSQPGGATPAAPEPTQELRLAVVLTGGVSLAVWMGGVAREINLLTQASRSLWHGAGCPSLTPAESRLREAYTRLLSLLDVDVSIDVLSGTSAGGINAAVLGLANARGLDIGPLRGMWQKNGALTDLLRDPREPRPASILKGDAGLLAGLNAGLNDLVTAGRKPPQGRTPTPGRPRTKGESFTKVFITTTLLKGEANRTEDDYGTVIEDTDHHGVFTFDSAALASDGNNLLAALALAARCSASFPGAFEPGFIPIGADLDAMHPDMASFIPLYESRFCADGGLLANRPIAPALAAIFDRPGSEAVRRMLAYVVPSASVPGAAAQAAEEFKAPPTLPSALVADLGSQMAQTIASELQAIQEHNLRVEARGDLRLYLARTGLKGLADPDLADLYDRCRRSLAQEAAGTVVEELVHRDPQLEDVRGVLAGIAAGVATSMETGASRGPATAATLGRPAFDGAKATAIALVRGAWAEDLSSADTWKAAVETVHAAKPAPRLSPVELAAEASKVNLPADHTLTPAVIDATVATANRARGADDHTLPGAWTALATALTEERFVTALRAAAARSPRAPFAVLASYLGLLADADPADGQAVGTTAQPPGPDAVIAKLVLLYVAERALSPQTRLLEQRIELVQVSADTRTFLDPSRFEATKKLNGLQLHHFASFYKCSWRANDWMWGRLDGLGWLVHILLDPKRLLALEASHEGWLSELPQRLADLAASAGAPDVTVPVESLPPKARAELDGLLARKDDPPASLPETATWAAAALQRLVLADELVAVARALDDDRKAGGAATPQASDFRTRYYSFLPATAQAGAPPDQDRTNLLAVIPPDSPAAPGAHPFDHLLTKCRISEETFKGERGSRLFTTTVTQAAAVAVSAVEAVHPVPPPMRPVAKAASWTTRTAYMAASHSTDSRGLNAAACFAVIAGGIGLMVTNQPLLSAAGFVAALAALFVLALLSRPGTPGKVVVALVVAAALAVTAALAAAVWIEPLRKPLFGWLTDGLGDFRDGRLPWVWLAIVVFLLAPPVVMVVDAVSDVRRRLAQRAAPPPPSTTTAPRTTSVATSPTTVPEPRRGADQPSVQ